MYWNVTKFRGEPDATPDTSRFEAIGQASADVPGWQGALMLRSLDEPGLVMRITMWDSAEDRDRHHASEAGRQMGLGGQANATREAWEVLAERRR